MPCTPCHTWADSPGGGMPYTKAPHRLGRDSRRGGRPCKKTAAFSVRFARLFRLHSGKLDHFVVSNSALGGGWQCKPHDESLAMFSLQGMPPMGESSLKRCNVSVQGMPPMGESSLKRCNVSVQGMSSHGRIQPQAVQCFRSGHVIRGRISDRFIPAFR